jgi:hypothetical protein
MVLKGHLFGISLTLFRNKYTNYEKGILYFPLARRVVPGIILYFFGPRVLNIRKNDIFELSCN